MTALTWNDERVDQMKKLWDDGLSASQIAKELGGVTRNAVIGKIHRSGWSSKSQKPAKASPRIRTTKPKAEPMMRLRPPTRAQSLAAVFMVPLKEETAAAVSFTACGIQFAELTDATCRWPIGDPAEASFYFCGGKALQNLPYCAHHCRIGYQPKSELRRIRPMR